MENKVATTLPGKQPIPFACRQQHSPLTRQFLCPGWTAQNTIKLQARQQQGEL